MAGTCVTVTGSPCPWLVSPGGHPGTLRQTKALSRLPKVVCDGLHLLPCPHITAGNWQTATERESRAKLGGNRRYLQSHFLCILSTAPLKPQPGYSCIWVSRDQDVLYFSHLHFYHTDSPLSHSLNSISFSQARRVQYGE